MRIPRVVRSFGSVIGLAVVAVNSSTKAQVASWQIELGAGQTVFDFRGPHHGVLGTTKAVERSDPTWATSGFIGRGLQFDGDDLVTIPNGPGLHLKGDMTICASFYIDQFSGDWVRIVGTMEGNGGTNRNYGLWYHPSGDALFQIYAANGAKANARFIVPIVPGRWYTMVGVRQGTGVRLYVDGRRIATANLSAAILPTKAPVTLGKAPIHAGHKGKIDRVVIYDRALTDSEIRTRYSFVSFHGDVETISVSSGGTQNLTLAAGSPFGGKSYWILGSMTGFLPGIAVSGIHINLNPDAYTSVVVGAVNTPLFTKFAGILDASGTATASLNFPAKLPIPTGFKLHHAYIVYDSKTGQIATSSNPAAVEFK